MARVEGRSARRFSALMAIDALTTALAYMLAVVVRFEGVPPAEWLPDIAPRCRSSSPPAWSSSGP
jgi:hypothetical protein